MEKITVYKVNGLYYENETDAKKAETKEKLAEILGSIWHRDMDYDEVVEELIKQSKEVINILEVFNGCQI